MAGMQFNPAAGNWNGDNGAGRVILYDANGNPIVYADGASPASRSGLAIGGVAGNTFELARADLSGGLASNNGVLLFAESFFNSTTLNIARWVTANTTLVPSSGVGGYSFNPTSLATANAVANMMSLTTFHRPAGTVFHRRSRIRYERRANTEANVIIAVPGGVVGTAVVTTGIVVRFAGDTVTATINNAGVEVQAQTLADLANFYGSGLGVAATAHLTLDVYVFDNRVQFALTDEATPSPSGIMRTLTLPLDATLARSFVNSRFQIGARAFNAAFAPAAPGVQFVVTDDACRLLDATLGRRYDDYLADIGASMLYLQESGPGAQAPQWTNSAEPALATLSNTAASYTTNGGKFRFAAVAGAVTDYALFGSVLANGSWSKTKIKRIRINVIARGVAVGAVAHEFEWFLAVNLTTAGNLTTAASRIPLGRQVIAANAPVSTQATLIDVDLSGMPVFIHPQRGWALGLRMPTGTATASLEFHGEALIAGTVE